MSKHPSPNGSNGRDNKGRFKPGNKYGKGNPHGRKVNELRSALLDTVTTDDMVEIVNKLIELAKTGSIEHVRELLQRTLGRPVETDLIERLQELEAVYENARSER